MAVSLPLAECPGAGEGACTGEPYKFKDSPTPLFLNLLLLTTQTLSLNLTVFRKLFFMTFFQSSHCWNFQGGCCLNRINLQLACSLSP